MDVTYKTNAACTTKSMAEWYFGKKFVATATASAMRAHSKSGETIFKFWQDGTGYLTIKIQ